MNWDQIRPKLIELIGRATGFPVLWRDREQPFISDIEQSVCLLHVLNVNSIDEDFRQEFDEVSNKIKVLHTQTNGFTLSVFVHSYSEADLKQATVRLERVRALFTRPAILAELRALDTTCYGTEEVVDLSDYDTGNGNGDRVISKASLDLRFSYVQNWRHEYEGDGLEDLDWIERAEDYALIPENSVSPWTKTFTVTFGEFEVT